MALQANEPRLWIDRGRQLGELGRWDEAKTAFAAAVKLKPKEASVWTDRGRTYADSPDIDCAIRVKAKLLRPGDFVKVKVSTADGYDLSGRALGKPW